MNKIRHSLKTIIVLLIGLFINSTINAQSKLTADVYASYFGGSGGEYNDYITVDKSGNVILAGHSYSSNLPTKSPFQSTNKLGPCDGYIAKFDPIMRTLIFSTFLGGDKYDEVKNVAVDSLGNIYVTGLTESQNFPVTANAFQKSHSADSGELDAFFTKLSPNGELLYSTYLGGNKSDCGYYIAAANPSIIYLVGTTSSSDFPVNPHFSPNSSSAIFLSKRLFGGYRNLTFCPVVIT
jgi:hypothetical protein